MFKKGFTTSCVTNKSFTRCQTIDLLGAPTVDLQTDLLNARFSTIALVDAKWLITSCSTVDFVRCITLQRHCTENSKQIFLEMKLRGLVPNSSIHVFVSEIYVYIFPRTVRLFCYRKIGGPTVEIYESITDTWLWIMRTRRHSFISGNT